GQRNRARPLARRIGSAAGRYSGARGSGRAEIERRTGKGCREKRRGRKSEKGSGRKREKGKNQRSEKGIIRAREYRAGQKAVLGSRAAQHRQGSVDRLF